MKRWWTSAIACVLVTGCHHSAKQNLPAARASAAPAHSGPVAAQPKVGSSQFYLELGNLYRRYHDPASAAKDFALAVDKARTPYQTIAAESALGQEREALGDLDGAIKALKKALAEQDKAQKAAKSGEPPPMMGPMGGGDLVGTLGRLYMEKKRYADAEHLYESALTQSKSPHGREQILRQEVELYRTAGTLNARIAKDEKALADKTADETALRFLAIAYGGGSMEPRPGAPAPAVDRLVPVYERLHQLEPRDAQIRQMLINLYVRSHRVNEAVALVRRQTPAQPAGPGADTACPGGVLRVQPVRGALATDAQVVRLLMRAGQKKQALAQTAKLVAQASDKGVGVSAYLTGAQLYEDEGKLDLAGKTLAEGTRASRTPEDRREVQAALAELYSRSGKTAELKSLYTKWKQSGDACLEAEAGRRESMLVHDPPGAMH